MLENSFNILRMFVRIYGASEAQTTLVSMPTRYLTKGIKPLVGILVCPSDVSYVFMHSHHHLRQILTKFGDLKR